MASGDEGHSSALGGKDFAWNPGKKGLLPNHLVCNYCKKNYKGGINRFKYHLVRISSWDIGLCDAIDLEVTCEKKVENKRTTVALGFGFGNFVFSDCMPHELVTTSKSILVPCLPSSSGDTTERQNVVEGFFIPRGEAQLSLDI